MRELRDQNLELEKRAHEATRKLTLTENDLEKAEERAESSEAKARALETELTKVRRISCVRVILDRVCRLVSSESSHKESQPKKISVLQDLERTIKDLSWNGLLFTAAIALGSSNICGQTSCVSERGGRQTEHRKRQ